MKIAGIQKNSFIDYRGKVATVVFTPFCNFDCFYCHNAQLLKKEDEQDAFTSEETFFSYLDKRHGLVDGIVVSGGEPTLQGDLIEFIKKIKNKNYPVKLDTNGYRPDVLKKLLDLNLLDYVAMDMKAPFDQYDDVVMTKVDLSIVKESMAILKQASVEFEYRTTVIPTFTLEDIETMAIQVQGSKYYVLQQFNEPQWEDRLTDIRNKIKPHKKAFFMEAQKICSKYVINAEIRGLKE